MLAARSWAGGDSRRTEAGLGSRNKPLAIETESDNLMEHICFTISELRGEGTGHEMEFSVGATAGRARVRPVPAATRSAHHHREMDP